MKLMKTFTEKRLSASRPPRVAFPANGCSCHSRATVQRGGGEGCERKSNPHEHRHERDMKGPEALLSIPREETRPGGPGG